MPDSLDIARHDSIVCFEPLQPFASLTDTVYTRALGAECDTVAAARPAVEVPDWHSGLMPEPRPMQPGNRSGFLLLIALMAVVMTYNFSHFGRVLRIYGKEVWRLRGGRDNLFDEHPAADTRILILMLIQCVVCCGILLCATVCRLDLMEPRALTGLAVGGVTGICALYYVAELCAYSAVGYAFSTPAGRREWLRGFNASQALLGIALILPAVLAVFYPPLTAAAVTAAAALYVCARLLFIIKGFRIFYAHLGSLLYFILYLCTLEIVPVAFVYFCSRLMVLKTI
ncbi:MAG: DUF4271 domain-containing protein [Bacteroides sp.]|nr:DUF4271 domain-containing protein [Bacteroides sp.]